MKALCVSRQLVLTLSRRFSIEVTFHPCRIERIYLYYCNDGGMWFIGNRDSDGLDFNDESVSNLHCIGNVDGKNIDRSPMTLLVNAILDDSSFFIDGFLPDIIAELSRSDIDDGQLFRFVCQSYKDVKLTYDGERTIKHVQA